MTLYPAISHVLLDILFVIFNMTKSSIIFMFFPDISLSNFEVFKYPTVIKTPKIYFLTLYLIPELPSSSFLPND